MANENNGDAAVDLSGLPQLLQQQEFLPLSYLPGVTREQAAAVLIDQLLPKVELPEVDIVLATDDERLEGIVVLEPLPWDSGIYGMPMGRVSVLFATGATLEAGAIKHMLMESAMQVAHDRGYQFLDFQPHVGDVSSIESASTMGFNVVGTCVCMVWDLSAASATTVPTASVVDASSEDATTVGEAAASAIDIYSRFAADPRLDPELAPEVFRQWAANSVHGYADRVNVLRVGEKVAGFTTWKLHKALPKYTGRKLANLDLAAVVPEARQNGHLTALAADGLHWLRAQEVELAEVVTHVLNTGMQRACSQLGARTLAARHSMHWHAEP